MKEATSKVMKKLESGCVVSRYEGRGFCKDDLLKDCIQRKCSHLKRIPHPLNAGFPEDYGWVCTHPDNASGCGSVGGMQECPKLFPNGFKNSLLSVLGFKK